MTPLAQTWIDALQLTPHPEGGYFRDMRFATTPVPFPDGRTRFPYTSIYFLLTDKSPSHFHRLRSDEVWYFHTGASLTVHCLLPGGGYAQVRLGLHPGRGEVLQARIPAGVIFGSTVEEPDGFALVSCMVAPGFDFQDFELFTQEQLLKDYAAHEAIVRRLAYEKLPE